VGNRKSLLKGRGAYCMRKGNDREKTCLWTGGERERERRKILCKRR
jgi:hypothetical protein